MYENVCYSVPKYYIGQTLFTDQSMPPEGIYYSYQEQDHLLMVILPEDDMWGPTRATILYEPTEFAIAVQENVLFFLSKFNNYPWHVAPYHHLFSSNTRQSIEGSGSAEGKLYILLINHLLGSIQGVRAINLPSDFVNTLNKILSLQLSQSWMDETKYSQALMKVRENYPSPNDLLSTTDVRLIDIPTTPGWLNKKHKMIFSS